LEGYKRALLRRAITINDRYITSVRKVDVDSKQRGAAAMAQLLRLKPRPDGVFCYNDPLATGAMDYAIEDGARIPGGCGDHWVRQSAL
jgi:LacI family transcriptional regulator